VRQRARVSTNRLPGLIRPRRSLIRRPNPSARRKYIDELVGLLFDGARRHCRTLLSFGLIVNS
jgi:hypothetical protein